MDLFLIRHAQAVARRDDHPDALRPLTPKGRKRLGRVVSTLDRAGVRFDRLVHSPLLRAIETAEACTELLDGPSEVTALLVGPPTDGLLTKLAGERVAAVGHEPGLSELAAWLVTGDSGQGSWLPLEKAGVAWLVGTCEPGGMVVRAWLVPDLCR